MAQDDNWTLTPVDIGLYDGLAGITLFLAYLGDVTGEQRYHGLAQDVTQTLLRHIERNRSLISSIGGFAGWGGVIYALMHVASVCDNSSLLDRADALLGRLPTLIDQDDRLDIIGGAAGCLAVLLALHRHTGSRHALDLAIRCGNHLIAQAQPVPAGLAWTVPGVGPRPLTGFSHGAAGLAWALLRLAGATGDERFRQTALGGIAYERSLFSPAAGNWPDLRDLPGLRSNDGDGREHMLTAWCHGAPGIGLARLDTVSLLDDHAVRQEIETALQTTLVTGFGGNHSLCHGALGNLELLFQAGGVFDDSRWQKAARQQMATTLTSIERDGWLCGHRLSVESPGLMTGLAGIGYGLLRYAAPDRVPSILLLEPPVRHDSEPTR
jgi:type 2 lantibiotic biosynthesis protein LanM